ncbi:MAG: histidinol-phosphate transaminase [Candidatus Hadarchaeales archaeon]
MASFPEYPFASRYGKGMVNLASNESPYPPSPKVLSALRGALRDVNLYPEPRPKELLKKIAGYVGMEVNNIIIGNGSDELIELVCRIFLNRKEKVLIPIPTFAFYEIAARLAGASPQFLQLTNFKWKTEEVEKAAKKAKMVFLGRPNNPTGNSLPEQGVIRLLEMGKIVVVDEAYAEFAGYSVCKLVREWDHLVVLRTFSKAFGLAGLRIGYAVAPPEIVELLWKVRAPFSVNSLALVAASAALDDLNYMKRVVERVRGERKRLAEELSLLGLRVLNSDANFLMVGVPKAEELCSKLEKRGILIRNLLPFRGVGEGWVRITVGTPSQNDRLLSALQEILK